MVGDERLRGLLRLRRIEPVVHVPELERAAADAAGGVDVPRLDLRGLERWRVEGRHPAGQVDGGPDHDRLGMDTSACAARRSAAEGGRGEDEGERSRVSHTDRASS